jgi:hypothetical protein
MRVEIPFISDIVGTVKDANAHAFTKATTEVDLREIALRDAPEAVHWKNTASSSAVGTPMTVGWKSTSTRWFDNGHWVEIEGHTLKDLLQLGIIEAIHSREPEKLAAKGRAKSHGSARKQFSDIRSDNTDETAAKARGWAKRNIVTSGETVLIRCPEPHYVVGCMFLNGRAVAPLLEHVTPSGFVRRKAFPIEHLVSTDENELARAVLNRIVADGNNPDYLDGHATRSEEIEVAITESIRHPWHVDSAALAIDRLVETGRERLDQMSTDDVRQWISLATMRDAGIDTEEKALTAMQMADRLQLSLRVSPVLVRQFRDRLHMSVYGVNPNRDMIFGGPTP